MRDVAIIGVGMTSFGKFPDKGIKELVREATVESLKDAGIEKKDIEAAYVGNSVAGLMTGQEAIRGQVTLSAMGIMGIPIFTTESACASSSVGLHLGRLAVAAGMYECVLVVGFEKLFDKDKRKTFQALGTAVDLEEYHTYFRQAEEASPSGDKLITDGAGENRSVFMDMYAFITRRYMERYGWTQEHFAKISVKSHQNGVFNPHAMYRKPVSMEEVLQSGDIVYPLTRMMCSPVCDGGSAVVLCSKSFAAKLGKKPIWVAASEVGTGIIGTDPFDTVTRRLAAKAYAAAGVGPEDVDVIEVHDGASVGELIGLVELGILQGEDGGKWVDEGYLEISGRRPVNTSGGLVTKGHPVGATGCGMIYEIVKQLRGEAGERQIQKDVRVGLTQNGGGIIGIDGATMAVHILKC